MQYFKETGVKSSCSIEPLRAKGPKVMCLAFGHDINIPDPAKDQYGMNIYSKQPA